MILIMRYLKERFNLCLFIPLGFLLTIGSETSIQYPINKFDIFIRLAFALQMLLWLRLWDDLSSIDKDRKNSPNRITVNPDNALILWKWFFILSLISFLLIYKLHNFAMVLIIFIFVIFFMFIYFLREKLNQLMFDLLILIKYPIIAFIFSSESTPFRDKILPLIIIYLILFIYEIFHDREHRSNSKYLKAGFVTWLCLLISFTSHIILKNESNRFESIKWGLLFVCMALFFLTIKYERIRNLKVIPFANGMIYLGFLAIPG
jgi:hypothetical protein